MPVIPDLYPKKEDKEKQMIEKVMGWHFLPLTKIPRRNSGQPCYEGQILSIKGDVALCRRGLHGCIYALDALRFASGPIACWCEFSGEIHRGDDKLAAQTKTIFKMFDATTTLREFAESCALEVEDLLRPVGEKERDPAREAARESVHEDPHRAAWGAAREAAVAVSREASREVRNHAEREGGLGTLAFDLQEVWKVTWLSSRTTQRKRLNQMLEGKTHD